MHRTILALLCLLGSAIAADPVASTPQPFFPQTTATGVHRITFKARIDAVAELVIQDGRMFLNSKGAKPAENITVNKRKWNAVFTNNVSEDFKFSSALMPFNGKPVAAKLIDSRGSANIREQPTAANGQKLVLRLEDSAAGPSEFELLITW
jgi:hypothetical protein